MYDTTVIDTNVAIGKTASVVTTRSSLKDSIRPVALCGFSLIPSVALRGFWDGAQWMECAGTIVLADSRADVALSGPL